SRSESSSFAMPCVNWWPCVPFESSPQKVAVIELTACPPSSGWLATRTTVRPSLAACSAADTPAIPAPTTQMSASSLRGGSSCSRRTMVVRVVYVSAMRLLRFPEALCRHRGIAARRGFRDARRRARLGRVAVQRLVRELHALPGVSERALPRRVKLIQALGDFEIALGHRPRLVRMQPQPQQPASD